MNKDHRAIRAALVVKSPERAIDFIKACNLPEDEELMLIECDIKHKSYIKVSTEQHVSESYIKSTKKRAYAHIKDALDYRDEKSNK